MGLSFSHQEVPTYAVVLPDTVLDKPCSEEYLQALAPFIQCWEQFSIYLNISKSEKFLILYNSPDDIEDQKVQSLLTWKRRLGKNATYRVIFEIFDMVSARELSDTLIAVLQKTYPNEIAAHNAVQSKS